MPDGEDVQRVLIGLREYNYSHVESDIRDLGIFVRDRGQIIAGLYGTSMWDWLHIKVLGLHPIIASKVLAASCCL